MVKNIPGFSHADIELVFSSTPVTWSNWVYRKKGRVGGIPLNGLYLVDDTVFPGQGIPGVTLSGINVYYKISKHLNKIKFVEFSRQ